MSLKCKSVAVGLCINRAPGGPPAPRTHAASTLLHTQRDTSHQERYNRTEEGPRRPPPGFFFSSPPTLSVILGFHGDCDGKHTKLQSSVGRVLGRVLADSCRDRVEKKKLLDSGLNPQEKETRKHCIRSKGGKQKKASHLSHLFIALLLRWQSSLRVA